MWIGWQDQGGGMRRIAALFGHSDNDEHAIRDQASRPRLSPTGSQGNRGKRGVGTIVRAAACPEHVIAIIGSIN